MRFGFATIPAQPFEALCDLVRLAEGLGFARAWVPDQAFFQDPFVLLGALAQRVGRIGLGLGVVNPYTRHPALVACRTATVADMCPGRLTLAYGAGNRREMLGRLWLDEGDPAPVSAKPLATMASISRVHRLEELVAWQKGKQLAVEIYRATGGGALSKDFGPAGQMPRPALSIPSNVAEA